MSDQPVSPPIPPHPDKMLRMMLDAKGWTQDELSAVAAWSRQTIGAIIGVAFENDPAEWLRWKAQYELAMADTDRVRSAISGRPRCNAMRFDPIAR